MERIDTNKDGYVSHTELHHWIKHRQRRYIEENVNKNWKDYDQNQDGKIGWEEYKNTTYGYYLGNKLVKYVLKRGYICVCVCVMYIYLLIFFFFFLFAGEEFSDVEDKATYQAMLARDNRRFKYADQDRDGIATREEFTAFLHPEEFDYMKDVVVQVYTVCYSIYL